MKFGSPVSALICDAGVTGRGFGATMPARGARFPGAAGFDAGIVRGDMRVFADLTA